MKKPKYRFSATLLDSYKAYLDGAPFFPDFDSFLVRLNGLEFQETEKMRLGKEFESSLVFYLDNGTFSQQTPIEWHSLIIEMAQGLDGFTAQMYVEYEFDWGIVYGYMDFSGFGRGIDIKTTGNYEFPKYLDSQQWRVYLLGSNCHQFDYIITDFKNVYLETYHPTESMRNDVNALALLLIDLIEQQGNLITNPKLFL